MEMLTNSVLLVLGRAKDLMRSALCVLASEDTGAKRSMLPVAWVGAVMMAAAVVLGMPAKAHAGVCWADWGCDTKPAYFCKGQCNCWCEGTTAWACVRYGSGPYRCKCW